MFASQAGTDFHAVDLNLALIAQALAVLWPNHGHPLVWEPKDFAVKKWEKIVMCRLFVITILLSVFES